MRAYTYKVTVVPAVPAVTLDTFKDHIKRTGSSEDDLLTLYLNAAIKYGEKLTRRDFITRTYETFRDGFPLAGGINELGYSFGISAGGIQLFGGNIGFELRKSPLQSITSVEHLVSAVFVTVASTVYYNTEETDYSSVLTLPDQEWPTNTDIRFQSVKITFKTGFGDADTDIPEDIANAILDLATALWKHRGDCDEKACSSLIPPGAKMTFLQNRIENL